MGAQAFVVAVIALAWCFFNVQAMTSTLLGGLVSILPNIYFARRFFASGRSADAKKIVRTFYLGELFKLLITVALALLVITQLPVLILPFLTGLVAATLGLWFAPVFANRQRRAAAL